SVYLAKDSTVVDVIAYGITDKNKKYFRYHIILNDSIEITSWKVPSRFSQLNGAEHPYAVLWSGYHSGSIVLEVYDIRDYSNREGTMINWNSAANVLPRVINFSAIKRITQKGTFSYITPYHFSKDSLPNTYFSNINSEYNY